MSSSQTKVALPAISKQPLRSSGTSSHQQRQMVTTGMVGMQQKRSPRGVVNDSLPSAPGSSALLKKKPQVANNSTLSTSVDPQFQQQQRVSKLESEVLKLEQKGSQLIQMPGSEVEGIVLLEKALWARTRFGSIQGSSADVVWQRGESFVVTCNQLAARVMQTLDDGYVHTANQLMASAERTLCNTTMDPFAGFHPLRQHLLSMTLNNHAVLQRMNGEPPESIVMTLEKALAVEDPRPSTLSLLNMAAAYIHARQFDDAMEMATRCISLANHYLTLPSKVGGAGSHAGVLANPVFKEVVENSAVHAVLTHHMIATLAQWAGGTTQNIAHHHTQLAFACATQYLGSAHALTTRCINRLDALENGTAIIPDPDEMLQQPHVKGGGIGSGDMPPPVSLQPSMVTTKSMPSVLLPFALAFPLPSDVAQPPPRTVDMKLPPIAEQQLGKAPQTAGGSRNKDRGGTQKQAQRSLKGRFSSSAKGSPTTSTTDSFSASALTSRSSQKRVASTPQQKKRGVSSTTEPKVESARRSGPPSAPAPPVRGGKPLFTRETVSGRRDSTTSSTATSSPALVPAPPTKQVSVIPKREYELYQQLQQQVRHYVANAEQENSVSRRMHSPVSSYVRSRVEPNAFSPSEKLHQLNEALGEVSQVFPDHTDAEERMWSAAVQTLQRWYRGCRARKVFHERQSKRDALVRRLGAQASIRHWWTSFKQVRGAREILNELRAIKARDDAVIAIQSFARTHLSLEEYGQRVLEFYQEEQRRWQEHRRKVISATMIQSLYRGHTWRAELHRRSTAARRIQRTIRLRKAFLICRILIFNRRVAKRKHEAMLNATALRLQTWAMKCINSKKAHREMNRRRSALEEYLEDYWHRDQQYWLLVQNVDERVCLETLQKVGRGLLARIGFNRFKANMIKQDRAARTLQRWFSFLSAESVKLRKNGMYVERRSIQRRIEEVREATIDIQALARRFLTRCRYLKMLDVISEQHAAARKIQKMARYASNRNQLQTIRDERKYRGDRYEHAQLRTYSATKIQSIYRMRRDQIFAARYKRFMVVDRHELATKMQRNIRKFLARRKRQALMEQHAADRAAIVLSELQEASARRIQSAVRMFLEKQRKHKSITEPIERRRWAARLVQHRWRIFAARQRVSQLLEARRVHDQVRIHEEHRAVYAMQIQSSARRAFLNKKKVDEARERLENHSVLMIQCAARRYLGRLHVARLLIIREDEEERDFDQEELHFAAMRIQKTLRGHQRRKEHLAKIAATTKIANFMRCVRAKERVMLMRAQRDGKEDHEQQEDAAVMIQQAWRNSHPSHSSTSAGGANDNDDAK